MHLRQGLTASRLLSGALAAAALVIGTLGLSGQARADASVSWLSPPNGSTYATGTVVMPEGQASGSGATGQGLDLAIVMDSSGSMGSMQTIDGEEKSLREWQQLFAKQLLNNLPTANTSVTIIEFDSSASTVQALTPLVPASNITQLENAIDTVDSSGSTSIGSGVDEAAAELLGGTAGRQKQIVLFSDGSSFNGPSEAAAAFAQGVTVNTVAMPGADTDHLQDVADDGGGTFTDGSDLQTLIDLFGGGQGNLVGLDRVDVELPDGTILQDVATDALGNFKLPGYALQDGANTFTATAYADDGGTAQAVLVLNGDDDGGIGQISAPGAAVVLLPGLIGLIGLRRRNRR